MKAKDYFLGDRLSEQLSFPEKLSKMEKGFALKEGTSMLTAPGTYPVAKR